MMQCGDRYWFARQFFWNEFDFSKSHFLINKALTGFVETLSFQQIVKHLFTGDSARPPEPPALCDCAVLPSLGLSLHGGVRGAGTEALYAVAPKSVKKMF